MWHEHPRPMLQVAPTDWVGPQTDVWPRKPVQVLCDDGLWHDGVLHTWLWTHGVWVAHVYYYAAVGQQYSMWGVYRAAALRLVEVERLEA